VEFWANPVLFQRSVSVWTLISVDAELDSRITVRRLRILRWEMCFRIGNSRGMVFDSNLLCFDTFATPVWFFCASHVLNYSPRLQAWKPAFQLWLAWNIEEGSDCLERNTDMTFPGTSLMFSWTYRGHHLFHVTLSINEVT
jgi:hypothetical protein